MSEAQLDLSELISDEFILQIAEAMAAKRLKRENPYVFDLIRALAPYLRVSRRGALDAVYRRRIQMGLPLPKTFDSVVQASLQYYCRDAAEFLSRGAPPEEALFYWPKGRGAGYWALDKDVARQWAIGRVAEMRKRLQR